MEVELWPIDRPVPYARNARKIPPTAVDKVAASIKEFGWRQPIVVDGGSVIVAGHTRLLAAQKLGLTQVPVHVATGLTPAQVKAYRLMDNRSHEEAAWDMDLLPLELEDLKALSFDLELTGFDDQELGGLLSYEGMPGLTDENAVPEAPEQPRSKPGDVWLLGNHRLVCGDCRVVYCWHAGKHAAVVQESLERCGFEIRSQIIWAKNRFALSRGNYHWQHEPCWYAVKTGGDARWGGDRSQSTLWQIQVENLDTNHGAQKPVECMRRPMQNNSSPGQAVYEPFCGSGTSIIAAEQTGRICYAIEVDPIYVDVAVKRWQNFTGRKATLEGTGETFDSVAVEREVVTI